LINESKNQQYIRGTQENIELLQETKEKFIKELNQLLLDAEQCVMNLCDLCLDKLLSQIDYEFMKEHCMHLKECNNNCLSDYLVRIGL
jgi:predicted transcriptional regulator